MSATRNTKVQTLTIEVTVPGDHADPSNYSYALSSGFRDYLGLTDTETCNVRLVSFEDARTIYPPINEKLLADVVAWAAAEHVRAKITGKSEWHQAAWISQQGTDRTGNECGTAFCLAGKVAVTEGWLPEDLLRHKLDPENYPTPYVGADWSRVAPVDIDPDEFSDYSRGVSEVAQEKLGLTTSEASQLFEGNNSIERIVELAEEFVERRRPVVVDEDEVSYA
jgi:hypothetical protein